MSVITSRVNIIKRYWDSPMNDKRRYEPYRWNNAVSTADMEYLELPVMLSETTVVAKKPSEEYLRVFAEQDGNEANYYYMCEFQMSDFSLYGKVSTDLCCDETGRDFYIDIEESKYYSQCENPLEDEEDLMFINRLEDGTFHLNSGFELLSELEERGYNGKVWAFVSDYTN